MLPFLDSLIGRLRRPFPIHLVKAQGRTRIVKAEVKRLALCKRGKNGLTTLYKADGSLQFETLSKALDEGTLLAVMYAPERADADGHIASQDVCKQMIHSLMRNGAELDIEHDGKVLTKAQAYIAEAFMVQKADARFADWKNYDGSSVGDLTGAAAVQINIDDPALRESRRKGEWDGISLFGTGEGVPERVDLTKTNPPQDTPEMTPEQLKQILDGFTAGLASLQTTLVKAVTDTVKPPEAKPEAKLADAPAFEGDATNPADLEKFEKSLRSYELTKAIKGGTVTAEKIAEMRKALTDADSAPSDAELGVEPGDSSEVRSLRLQLHKARRASNAGARPAAPGQQSQAALDVAEGLELAKAMNGDAKSEPFQFRIHAG